MATGLVLLLIARDFEFAVFICLLYGWGFGCFFAVVWAYWTSEIKEGGAAKDMG